MRTERMILVVLLALVVVSGVACASSQRIASQGSRQAMGADCDIRVDQQDGGNYSVTVNATNLLPPARLDGALTTYVVWFQPADQTPLRVGTLDYDEGSRRGQMMATTAYSSFQVIISGEASADVASPSDTVVFRASVESQ